MGNPVSCGLRLWAFAGALAMGCSSDAGGSSDGGDGTDGGSDSTSADGDAGSDATDGGADDGSGGDDDGGTDTGTTGGIGRNLTVVSVDPVARGLSAPVDGPITITFDRPVDQDSVGPTTLWPFGRWSGPVRDATYTFSDDDRVVTLDPPRDWSAGDRVTVVLSHDLMGEDGTSLRAEGYSFQFSTVAGVAPLSFSEVQTLSTQTGSRTQSYGGSAADLDGDGFLDLIVVNEISADLRIFMNDGDGNGTFTMNPEFVAVDRRASPSETTDFDGDGIVDLVVANLDGDNLSVLLGTGTGTFVESQRIDVGEEPRGVAVFDFDGDGDIDVVNTNANSDNLSLLLNDGSGTFPTTEAEGIVYFDAGHGEADVGTEFGLMAGDMNEDAILDIVIGGRGIGRSGTVVNLGVGDGTFAFGSFQAPATTPWQLAVGDLNGDGHEDVATADGSLSQSVDTVTLLLGDGSADLTITDVYEDMVSRPFAIDVGDLDGDGDLDVVVSNFGDDWLVLENDGTGQVSLAQSVESDHFGNGAASCALLMDIDNDLDLDLALIDEIEDQVTFLTH